MGNTSGKVTACFTGAGNVVGRRKDASLYLSEPIDDLGHSFCYVRPDPTRISSSKVFHSEETTTFRSISGASVSANTSTPLSTALFDLYSYNTIDKASAFESSTSFSSIPLQPIPRGSIYSSGPLSNSGGVFASGPMERGFMSGPIERGFMSGPLDRGGLFSGPLEKEKGCSDQFQRSYSHGGFSFRPRFKKQTLIRRIQRALSKTHNSIVAPIKAIGSLKEQQEWNEKNNELTITSEMSLEDDDQNLQWAQGKAGEDRVHVVVSEEHGWVFVGIYDGFNGPDAPDYLLSSLYPAVHKELKGLLWEEEKSDSNSGSPFSSSSSAHSNLTTSHRESNPAAANLRKNRAKSSSRSKYKGAAKKWEENQRRWRCEWDLERLELERRLKEQLHQTGSGAAINHSEVLKALSQALKKTEEAYLDLADKMLDENPELALMGSCVLVMLMKGEDVYVMNVGDSRAVLAQTAEPDLWSQDLERISEETLHDLEGYDYDNKTRSDLKAVQFTVDHATSEEQEVLRIMSEHPDDPSAVLNDRVKGSLKVTRAFGAGFLKQPKWNDALLQTFRIDYIGTSPYINCLPSLYHHKLGPRDRFLILSSDGLYEYFTNEEAVSEVELFISWSPDGDPAQHLVEELLFRAAKKNGLDFYELLEIPQGDRRRYHDDVSIIVISLEGRIWRSCV